MIVQICLYMNHVIIVSLVHLYNIDDILSNIHWCNDFASGVYQIFCAQFTSNTLWPSIAIWWHRSRSKLVQVMACSLLAPSPYLNQCWFLINEVLWHHLHAIPQGAAKIQVRINMKTIIFNLLQHLPGGNELTLVTEPVLSLTPSSREPVAKIMHLSKRLLIRLFG